MNSLYIAAFLLLCFVSLCIQLQRLIARGWSDKANWLQFDSYEHFQTYILWLWFWVITTGIGFVAFLCAGIFELQKLTP